MEVKVYEKKEGMQLFKLFKESLKDIHASRFLAKQLAVRDIKAKYRKSYLGIVWDFLGPISTAFIWIFLNGSGTVQISDTGVPYPVYAFTGTFLWSIISESINVPASSTRASLGILNKVNFPKEALVVSGIYKLLFNSSFKILLLIAFLFIYGVQVQWVIVLFPLVMLFAIIFGTTIGLFLAPIGLLYNDIKQVISFTLRFMMFVTPVVYSVPKSGILKVIMELNPLTYILTMARDLLIGGEMYYLKHFLVTITVVSPLLFIGLLFYRISIPIIVERSNA